MKIEELKEAGVMDFIFSKDLEVESYHWDKRQFYATIGKLLEDAGLDVAPESRSEELVVESYEILDMEAENWGGRFKRWIRKGIRFVQRLMRKMMSWFCESDVVKDLRSNDSKIREKAVVAIYSAICTAFARFCRLAPNAIRKVIAFVIKGLTVGTLSVVCPKNNESYVVSFEGMV